MPRPAPLVAPVTTATLPVSRCIRRSYRRRLADHEVGRLELAGPPAEVEGESRPQSDVAPFTVQVPARASRSPYGSWQLALQLRVVSRCDLGPHLESAACCLRLGNAVSDVVQLALDHEQHGRVPEPGVRAREMEVVRETGHARA